MLSTKQAKSSLTTSYKGTYCKYVLTTLVSYVIHSTALPAYNVPAALFLLVDRRCLDQSTFINKVNNGVIVT